ncbi:MAG: tectonin domain-containing protein [Polyangiaceae bacterium]
MYDSAGGETIFYWLFQYNVNTNKYPAIYCPSGWTSYYNTTDPTPHMDCYQSTQTALIPSEPITNLANMTVTATSGSTDTVIVSTGDGKLYSLSASTSPLSLNTSWNSAEFNVFGYGDGSQANFNAGASIVVQVVTDSNTSTAAPYCSLGEFTGETNNLSFPATAGCCQFGGATPGIQFMESNASNPPAWTCPADPITVCETPADNSGVYRYNGTGTSWTQIGGAAAQLYGGGHGLFATDSGGNIHQYLGTPYSWAQVGGPGRQFAVTNEGLYGLSPNGGAVSRYNGSGTSWTGIGGAASQLYGGGYGFFATDSSTNIHEYLGTPNRWSQLGGPYSEYAVTDEGLYGLAPNGGAVYRYNGTGTSWTQVRGPTAKLYGGGYGLFATDPSTGNIYRYSVVLNNWSEVGGPGSQFAVAQGTLYGLNSNKSAVSIYNGTGTSWTQIAGPASQIVPCP